jgi:hypothetical protein
MRSADNSPPGKIARRHRSPSRRVESQYLRANPTLRCRSAPVGRKRYLCCADAFQAGDGQLVATQDYAGAADAGARRRAAVAFANRIGRRIMRDLHQAGTQTAP